MVLPGLFSPPHYTAKADLGLSHQVAGKQRANSTMSSQKGMSNSSGNKQDGRRSSSLLSGGGAAGVAAGIARSASFRANSYEASIGGVIASCRRRGGINNMLKTLGISKVEPNRNMPHVSFCWYFFSVLFLEVRPSIYLWCVLFFHHFCIASSLVRVEIATGLHTTTCLRSLQQRRTTSFV